MLLFFSIIQLPTGTVALTSVIVSESVLPVLVFAVVWEKLLEFCFYILANIKIIIKSYLKTILHTYTHIYRYPSYLPIATPPCDSVHVCLYGQTEQLI